MPPRESTRLPLPFLRWRGFTLQLFLFTILPLTLLLIVVTFGSLELHHAAMRDLVGDRDLRAARAAATSLENAFAQRAALLALLAESLDGEQPLEELLERQKQLTVVFDGGFAYYTASGELAVASGASAGWRDQLNPQQLKALSDGQWLMLGPREDMESTWLIAGETDAAGSLIAGAFAPQPVIRESVEPSFDTRHTTVLIVGGGQEMEVLYFTGPSHNHEPILANPGVSDVLDGESGIRYAASGGHEQVIAYAPIPTTGWGLVIAEAWEDISSPLLRTTQLAPLILVPVLLMALLALWFGARSIIQPLQQLERRAYDLAKGNFTAIQQPVGGINEIRNLQEQLIDMAQQLDAAQQSLRSYIGAITAGIENERRSLARDLHDDTIQNLIALNQRIQLAAMSPPEQQKAAVESLGPMVQAAIADLRRTIGGLRPIYLEDLGLVTALEMLARETSKVSGLPVEFEILGDERRLSAETEMMVYRMVQESLNNVTRHAGATQAWLALDFQPRALVLTVRDNGRGFRAPLDPSEFPGSGHFGLLGLHERADLIGAQLEIQSSPGGGTRVAITIPASVD